LILIRQLHVTGLRSIRDASIDALGNLTALVGKNSCGKSNVLRALNLFFNNEIVPGTSVSFQRDYYEQPALRKKKHIRIEVGFELPTNFKFRHQLDHLQQLGTRFRIARTWELDARRQVVNSLEVKAEGGAVPNATELGRQFLTLIFYRYIPNRSIPAALLRDESQALADSIFMRMKGDTHGAALMESLNSAADRLLKDAQQKMQSAGAPLTDATVATASSIGEMIKMSGFQATGLHGGIVQDEDWGAGHQAFFLYLVLHTLDTNYGRFWGWRQATLWGVEEPESGLHRDLETRLAQRFRDWSRDEGSKLQIIQTTHSPVFSMASDAGYWLALNEGETSTVAKTIPELTKAAEMEGVSGWVHPVLSFPWNPVVLVEGANDAGVLYHAASMAGHDHLRFLSLPELDRSYSRGGKDSILSYLRRHADLIENRPREAPLIVVLDWDVSSQELAQARRAYGRHGDRRVLRMDVQHCDSLLSSDFRGIERFYPPRVLLEAHHADELTLAIKDGKPYSVAKAQLDAAKNHLARRVLEVNEPEELKPLIAVVRDVHTAVFADRPIQKRLFEGAG
jgi:energy-coupling factor transporter ATP-binding protein EcfA2